MHSAGMKSLTAAGMALLSFVIAPLALAQTYYPATTGCVSVPAGLSIGSRGSGVLSLQQFLVGQNYQGGGSWMQTGYYGQATAAAVRTLQSSQGLPQTGWVDAATAATVSRLSCLSGQGGGVSYPTYPSYSYPSYPTYPYTNYTSYPSYPSFP